MKKEHILSYVVTGYYGILIGFALVMEGWSVWARMIAVIGSTAAGVLTVMAAAGKFDGQKPKEDTK